MILVTGATGFIGQALLQNLVTSGQDVRLLARHQVDGHEVVCCDFVTDIIPTEAVDSIDTIYHLAGYAHDLGDASKIEDLYRVVNVDATVRLAELAAGLGVQRFVFVSSVKAGGSAIAGQCMTEADQGEPEGVYGLTKREAELRLLEIGQQSGMHVSIVRPSLVYGAGVKGNLRAMISGIRRGWFPPLPDTSNRRSMIHVDDLVQTLLLVAKDEHANGEIFIVTDRQYYSTWMIYNSICEAVGRKTTRWSVPKGLFSAAAALGDYISWFPFDSYRYQKLLGDECYSSDKIRTLLGFESRHTLQSALPEMIDALSNEGLDKK